MRKAVFCKVSNDDLCIRILEFKPSSGFTRQATACRLSSARARFDDQIWVTRELFPEFAFRVEYELTALGRSLLLPMCGLLDWVKVKWQKVKESRTEIDAR